MMKIQNISAEVKSSKNTYNQDLLFISVFRINFIFDGEGFLLKKERETTAGIWYKTKRKSFSTILIRNEAKPKNFKYIHKEQKKDIKMSFFRFLKHLVIN